MSAGALLEFRLSRYGRLGYLVMLAAAAALVALCAFALLHPPEGASRWAFAAPLGLMVASGLPGLYFLSQLVRKSPRFELGPDGFVYRGALGSLRSDWTSVAAYRLRYRAAALVFLEVRLDARPGRLRRKYMLDVSGLKPDHETLVECFRRRAPRAAGA